MTYFHGFAGPLFSPRHQPPPTSPCTRVLACRTFLNQKSEQISKVFSLPSLSNGAKLLPNFSCTLRAPRIWEVIGYVRTPPRTFGSGGKKFGPSTSPTLRLIFPIPSHPFYPQFITAFLSNKRPSTIPTLCWPPQTSSESRERRMANWKVALRDPLPDSLRRSKRHARAAAIVFKL